MTRFSFVPECLIVCGTFFVNSLFFSYTMIILGLLGGIFAFYDSKNEKKESRENTLQLIGTAVEFISSSIKSSSDNNEKETRH